MTDHSPEVDAEEPSFSTAPEAPLEAHNAAEMVCVRVHRT